MPPWAACDGLEDCLSIFRAIDGFDMTFPLTASQDREFCDGWLHHSYQITYAPEVMVYHGHAPKFRSFWRQHFKYGRGVFHFHQGRA